MNNFTNFISIKKFLFYTAALLIKGFAIGVANVIPGLSGGTVAFLSGVYERLLLSINSICSWKTIRMAFQFQIKELFDVIDAKFLSIILSGILVGIFSVARYIDWVLDKHPFTFLSFLFGVMIGATLLLGKEEKIWRRRNFFSLMLGCFLGFALTIAVPQIQTENMLLILVSGIIVAGAMVLPGISGSYFLVMLGYYERMISAINTFDWEILFVFAFGLMAGVALFARIINLFINKYREKTFALLVGIVLGSLKSIWPWQNVSNVELEINQIIFMLIVMTSGLFLSIVIPFVTSILKQDK